MTKEEAIKSFEEDNRTMLENKTAYINELKARGMEFEDRMVSYIDESVERNELAISALKGGWIPIEERLPKCCGVYYVTRLLGDGFEEQYITDASFFDGSNKWHDDNRINHGRDYLDDVVAWFEVEPYKKGE